VGAHDDTPGSCALSRRRPSWAIMGAVSSHTSLEVAVAHVRRTARPQQLWPAKERWLGLPQSTALIAIPDVFCALAQNKWRWSVSWGPFPMAGAAGLVGVPVYLAGRGRMTAPRGR
jgi:hypothetical protein